MSFRDNDVYIYNPHLLLTSSVNILTQCQPQMFVYFVIMIGPNELLETTFKKNSYFNTLFADSEQLSLVSNHNLSL